LTDFTRTQKKPRNQKRPTADTKYNVDFDWWKESEMDLKTYLYQRLPIGDLSSLESDLDEVDLVDPETGEVRRVDGFEYSLQTFFSQLPDDFISRTSVVDAVFCVLLANGNRPLTIRELAKEVDRAPDVLLKTLAGSQIYQGIRPIF
jgi:hypothetical protein